MLNPVSEVIETINKERKQTEQSLDVLSKLREDVTIIASKFKTTY